ncbi:MAG TPA: ATP-binding SpoIIE family protein phosphatase [Acidimicrobiales bacterium]|nr:ATP-binding SpoIIE family protein phosphatase [Acidimicrobiales bacterium]
MTPVEDLEWIAVEEPSAVGRARRAAMGLASRLGFDEDRSGEVGLAATELATNLHRHAAAGSVALRVRRSSRQAAVELVVTDAGPGIDDLDAVMADGHSSAGTLGVGLGVVRRLATSYDAHSVPGRGTVVVATFWSGEAPPDEDAVALLTRPIAGEVVCGDAGAWLAADGVRTVIVADGLGHGPVAATAARGAVRAFEATGPAEPADMLAAAHRALAGTRGAAVSVAQLDAAAGRVRFAGVGNVAGWIDDREHRRRMVSFPGIVGHKRPRIRQVDYPLAPGALVVLHSDGLSDKWAIDDYPGLRRHDGLVAAATLMRDAGIRHDDASVLVARSP